MEKLPENDYQILHLTNDFYSAYPNPPFVEILEKNRRAYSCLIFQSHYDYFICVPFRSEIPHKYAYRFKGTKRSIMHKSGLDYTKIVIVNKNNYIGTTDAIIDKDEFNETMIHLEQIKKEALDFVEGYINHHKGTSPLDPNEFKRRYAYSPLQYFHAELGI